ncbi:MAG: hypothetical protein ABSF43_02315 [Rectinemataceae bacterium]
MAEPIAKKAQTSRERLIEGLTFSSEVRSTTATINRLCSRPFDRMHLFFDGHVSGIKNLVYNKAIDMALLYGAIRSTNREDRLVALARLRDEAYNFQGLEMPYNTRRILIALMKETVKAKVEPPRQHRYMAAFNQALSGRAYVVRTMLDELGLAEVPEATGARVDGWDDHVYDNAGPGRKTPAQLVLDAYIKGLSRLTIVYEDVLERAALEEAVEAGRLMGIQVTIGLECLVQTRQKRRFYHVLLLRGCGTQKDLNALLEAPSVKGLLRLVHGNYAEYDRLYAELIHQFNRKSLPVINEGFESTEGEMKHLSVEGLRAQAKGKYLFHAHLGQLLYHRLAKLREARRLIRPGSPGVETLKAAELRKRFFDPLYKDILAEGDFVKAEKLYAAVAEVEKELGERRIGVAYTRPLDDPLEVCVRQLLGNASGIDAIEIWSNRARQEGYADECRFLEALRRDLNRGDGAAAAALIAAHGIEDIGEELTAGAAERYMARPLGARIGSHSDGYKFMAPGMGFVPRREVRNWRAVLWTNKSSPLPVTMPGEGLRKERIIIPLGKDRGVVGKPAAITRPLSLIARWGDLNSTIRDVTRMMGGALLALMTAQLLSILSGFPPSFGLFTLGAFFAITYGRNFIVDEIARHGLHPSRWRPSSFDATNAANSVFFSFMSIPLLRFIEQFLDRFAFNGAAASFGFSDFAIRLSRFIPLALVNGAYIYSHNSLRGFTKPVKRANFLRSAPSFLLAIGLSYLNPWPALISGVIVNKVASDIIGGFTEAVFKILRESKRARQMYAALLPHLAPEPKTAREKYVQRLAILDILYVWGNSPRGKDALKKSIAAEKSSDLIWNRLETPVHRYESFVKLITGKTAWRKPQKIKLEFLRLAAAFSYWLERNGPASKNAQGA